MKRILLIPIVLTMLASVASAVPLCTNDTWQFYIDNYQSGCQIADKIFSLFGYSASAVGTTPVDASQISVQPQTGDNVTTFPGLFFSAGGFTVGSNQSKDSTLTYTVTAPAPFFITGAKLVMAGRIVSGTGVASVQENLKLGAADIPGSPISVSTSGAPQAFLDFVSAGGTWQSSLNITTAVHVQANAGSFVTLSNITETFPEVSTTPEPVQSILIGSGVLLLGLISRKRKNRWADNGGGLNHNEANNSWNTGNGRVRDFGVCGASLHYRVDGCVYFGCVQSAGWVHHFRQAVHQFPVRQHIPRQWRCR